MKTLAVINIGLNLKEVDKLISELKQLRTNKSKTVKSVGAYGSLLAHEYPAAVVEDEHNKVSFYRT